MLIRVETNLPGFILNLAQAAIIQPEKRGKEEDTSFADTVTATHYREKELQNDQITRLTSTKKSEPSMIIS